MFWFIFAVALYLTYRSIPTPQSQPPPGLGDVKAPTVEEGREIPVLFGTREIEGPMIVWYGDFRSVPVQKKGGKK